MSTNFTTVAASGQTIFTLWNASRRGLAGDVAYEVTPVIAFDVPTDPDATAAPVPITFPNGRWNCVDFWCLANRDGSVITPDGRAFSSVEKWAEWALAEAHAAEGAKRTKRRAPVAAIAKASTR